jgi:hypothetical protein
MVYFKRVAKAVPVGERTAEYFDDETNVWSTVVPDRVDDLLCSGRGVWCVSLPPGSPLMREDHEIYRFWRLWVYDVAVLNFDGSIMFVDV